MPSRRENYFLLVSEFKDQTGDTINVPVYIEEGAICNKVYLTSNKIATVFGKDDFRQYINEQIKNKNLVRIKNKSSTFSEGGVPLTPAYESAALNDSIPNLDENVKQKVFNASKNNGYNSPLLYHGTQSFGFTEFDLDKMDDKQSIFLTSNPDIVST